MLKIGYEPLDSDPLVDVYGGTSWGPWPVNIAAERFLGAMRFYGAE